MVQKTRPVRCLLSLLCLLAALFCACGGETDERESARATFFSTAERAPEELAILQTKTVILDPGHGFDDPGCPFVNSDTEEQEISLVLAQKIRDSLERDGVTVRMTHDGVTFPDRTALDSLAETLAYDPDAFLDTLISQYSGRTGEALAETVSAVWAGIDSDGTFGTFERSYYANLLAAEHGADLFVSVHINASANLPSKNGFDLFICSDTPYAAQSKEALSALRSALTYGFPQARCGVTSYGWDDAFVVNKYTDMPSVLIESGFATNETDAENLQNAAWQDRYADTVARGVELFLLGK